MWTDDPALAHNEDLMSSPPPLSRILLETNSCVNQASTNKTKGYAGGNTYTGKHPMRQTLRDKTSHALELDGTLTVAVYRPHFRNHLRQAECTPSSNHCCLLVLCLRSIPHLGLDGDRLPVDYPQDILPSSFVQTVPHLQPPPIFWAWSVSITVFEWQTKLAQISRRKRYLV
ncbi:hypothetical protein OG21DRAFT_371831 [Imleria badia]|nr:hypothetical protein OG21DRAFT_371831 [Imleria badia]